MYSCKEKRLEHQKEQGKDFKGAVLHSNDNGRPEDRSEVNVQSQSHSRAIIRIITIRAQTASHRRPRSRRIFSS
jgi:hypothetical protein